MNTMFMLLTYIKELELIHEAENDSDEYCNSL